MPSQVVTSQTRVGGQDGRVVLYITDLKIATPADFQGDYAYRLPPHSRGYQGSRISNRLQRHDDYTLLDNLDSDRVFPGRGG